MQNGFSRMAKASLVALAMVTGGSSLSFAAPYGAFAKAPASVADSAAAPRLVVDGEFRGGTNPRWRRGGGDRREFGGNRWRNGDRSYRDGRGWRGGDRGWNRGWRNGDRWRHGRNRDYYGGAAVLGLGLLAAPRYYAPEYEYVEPRRVYRSVGNTHVQWCYNRYRSYRASDNSFQPYNGPRQQCYSPYS